MQLTGLDWAVIAIYFAVNLGIGFFYMKRASGNVGEFFLSGRNVPWWLAGTSMVATTFGADTPLVVTGLVYSGGIAGNWLWWSFCLSGMLTVFFFAPLWRRAKVLTDMEFAELRYAGPAATFLRAFRAVYLAIPVNTIIMGWVNLAMAKVLALTLGLTTTRSQLEAVGVCLLLTLAYNAVSGLWAVLWTDLIQFILKMSMVVALAFFAVHAVGGMESLAAQVHASDLIRNAAEPGRHTDTLAFVPSLGSGFFLSFLVLMSLNWWASWYPGAEPGGGGYIAQRIFSAKDEANGIGATLWFNIAHYALRPWPWIATALVALVLLPNPSASQGGYEGAYVWVMIHYLPPSLRGLMLAGFAAAYMSTIGTHLNLGASYLINDLYKRFFVRDATERHYVNASRIATILVAILSAGATAYMKTHGDSIAAAWKFLLALGAGAGLVFILRWYWWRINAWSEITAMTAAATISLTLESPLGLPVVRALHALDPSLVIAPLNSDDPHAFAWLMLITTVLTTGLWLTVTLLTRPESDATLQHFYTLVRPAAFGWKRFATPAEIARPELRYNFLHWVLGFSLIYATLFGVGNLLFSRALLGTTMLAFAAICLWLLFRSLSRRGWGTFR
jgi:SSS family solute:Na+ symporter